MEKPADTERLKRELYSKHLTDVQISQISQRNSRSVQIVGEGHGEINRVTDEPLHKIELAFRAPAGCCLQ